MPDVPRGPGKVPGDADDRRETGQYPGHGYEKEGIDLSRPRQYGELVRPNRRGDHSLSRRRGKDQAELDTAPRGQPPRPPVAPPPELSRRDEIRLWAAAQGIQLGNRGRIPVSYIARYEAATGTPTIARLTKRVTYIEEDLTDQLAESGIWLTEGGPELDVVEDVDFSFELRKTPSTRQLIAALTEVDKLIRMAAGFAGYTHPDLGVLSGGRLEDLASLDAMLQQDSADWDLQIEYLGLGSLHLKLKPSGKNIKKVVKDGAAVAAVLANLATFTGFTVKAAAPSSQGNPRVSHSVVYADNKKIPLPPPRKHEVIVQLPAGSTITETTRLNHGKRIEWKFKVGPGGAIVSGDWSG